jgi:hypothetical protein
MTFRTGKQLGIEEETLKLIMSNYDTSSLILNGGYNKTEYGRAGSISGRQGSLHEIGRQAG